jgi:hypothetical protein
MTLPVTSSTDLLTVGKGIGVFKPLGGTTFIDLGNCPAIELSPQFQTLDHFSSRRGVKLRDKRIITEKLAELRIVMEEWAAQNLAILLGADIDNTDPTAPILNIGTLSATTGEFRFYGTNDVGPKWNVVFPSIDFLPTGKLNLISDGIGEMEVTGSMLANTDTGSFGTMTPRDDTGLPPVNIAEPVISGGATEGDVLTGSTGTWLGSPTSFTYVWKRNGVAIAAATAATYTLTAPDIHASITVTVTATNANGSDTATSAARIPTAY